MNIYKHIAHYSNGSTVTTINKNSEESNPLWCPSNFLKIETLLVKR